MNFTAFFLFIIGLQMVCLLIGGRFSKGVKTQEDYFLAGRSIRFFPLMMTFVATQVGGGVVLGAAQEAYQYGWTVLFYPLGAVIGMLLLGLGVGRKLAQFQVSTVAQIFEVVYRSPGLKKIASLLSVISLFMILVAQVSASSKFMISIGAESSIWFTAFWGIVIVYTVIGGLKGVVAIDIVQATFFIIAFFICFGYVLCSPEINLTQIFETNLTNMDFSMNSDKIYGWLFMPLLFMVIEQDMAQRCFAGASPSVVSKATLCAAGCILIVCVIPVFFGVLAKNMGITIEPGASVLMTAITKTTNPLMTALLGCAILAVIISTAESLINAISSNLSQDFDLSFMNKGNIRISQGITAAIALFSIGASYYFDNVVDLLIVSYELSVCCLFVPIFAALWKRQGNTLSAILAIVFGALGFILFRINPIEWPKELMSVLLSLAGYCFGEILAWSSAEAKNKVA